MSKCFYSPRRKTSSNIINLKLWLIKIKHSCLDSSMLLVLSRIFRTPHVCRRDMRSAVLIKDRILSPEHSPAMLGWQLAWCSARPGAPMGGQPELALQHPCHGAGAGLGLCSGAQRVGKSKTSPRWAGQLGCSRKSCLCSVTASELWHSPIAQPWAGAALGVPCLQAGLAAGAALAGDGDNNFSSTSLLIISSPVTGGSRFCEGCFFTHSVTDIKLT